MDSLDIRRTRPAGTNLTTPLRETASQTAGPYVHIGCLPNSVGVTGIYSDDLTRNKPLADAPIKISGKIFEGEGLVCKDMMLEFWQADERGSYENGIWQRTSTNLESGLFSIETQMPGKISTAEGCVLAPFISVWVTARGLNLGLLTRIYFPEHENVIAEDPHMALVPESRRGTLLAKPMDGGYLFDIHLQGAAETVFFDV
jgi:protocatechuate 3,4-dioxygenase alpha subunit